MDFVLSFLAEDNYVTFDYCRRKSVCLSVCLLPANSRQLFDTKRCRHGLFRDSVSVADGNFRLRARLRGLIDAEEITAYIRHSDVRELSSLPPRPEPYQRRSRCKEVIRGEK